MTHWIVEHMEFHSRGLRYHAGMRISCDDGVSWVVAGTVPMQARDSFTSRTRAVGLAEFVYRCEQWPRSIVVVPPARTQP